MTTTERVDATDIGGRRFAWRTRGEGPVLLLVNGYAATASDWDPEFLSRLADSLTLICPDNRGVGGSQLGDLADPLTIDTMARDLVRLLDRIGLERVAVAGWSMGGFVAQQLARRAPGRVDSLVLLSTDCGGPDAILAEPRVWAELIDHTGTPRVQASRLISLLFPSRVAATVDREFGDAIAARERLFSVTALNVQEAAMDAWHEVDPPPPDAGLRVFIACGIEDVVIPPANADALARLWPASLVERFSGCGHAFMAQEPDRLARLITEFVVA